MLDAVLNLFERGGPVMWPLLILSVVSITLTFERSLYWLRQHAPGRRRRLAGTADALREGDLEDARRRARDDRSVYGRVVGVLLGHRPSDGLAIELVELHRGEIERFGATLATITTAAPLLGILGTVLGIIDSFELLGDAQAVVDVAAVAGGIAEALITTAFGLVVALITLFPMMVFRAQGDRCVGMIEMLAAARLGAKG